MVQNRCLKISLNVERRFHTDTLHQNAHIELLCTRYDLQLLLLLHKYMYGGTHCPDELGLVFQKPVVDGRVTRSTNTGMLACPPNASMAYRKSPLYRGIVLWNSLNASSRLAKDRDTFKRKAKPTVVKLLLAKRNS